MTRRVLVARLDNAGDVLLAGPCVRAVAAHADSVTLLAGPRGRAAADLLPGVDRVIEWCAPWIDPEPPPLTTGRVDDLVRRVREVRPDAALIITSFHQSPLPLAMALRMAGVPWIGAISEDYPGSLLDLRHRVPGDPPEAERALSLARAAGYDLPPGDDGRLAVRRPLPDVTALTGEPGYVVVHPSASVPARQPSAERCAEFVRALREAGHRVLVTGAPAERELTARVAGESGVDLGGRTGLAELAAVLGGAGAVVAPNTGPAHLAAAVGAPVVSLFAPVVPAERWAPYGVPTVLLGDQRAPCRASRARECPVPGHPCLDGITPDEVVAAVAAQLPDSGDAATGHTAPTNAMEEAVDRAAAAGRAPRAESAAGPPEEGSCAVIEEHFATLGAAAERMRFAAPKIESWGRHLAAVLGAGGRLLACGNGGSAAEAQHLTGELVGKFRNDRRPLSAIALHADTSSGTAIINDYGETEYFARQVRAHGRPGDVLVALSTSGGSQNVVTAAKNAHEIGVTTWALTGPAPNPLAALCDDVIAVDAPTTATVQEMHLVLVHALCLALDDTFGVAV
jgi:phosphoheptose isomerase/ADP-heptose:LPS heptosyltransferase